MLICLFMTASVPSQSYSAFRHVLPSSEWIIVATVHLSYCQCQRHFQAVQYHKLPYSTNCILHTWSIQYGNSYVYPIWELVCVSNMGTRMCIQYENSYVYPIWELVCVSNMGTHMCIQYGNSYVYPIWELVCVSNMGTRMCIQYGNSYVYPIWELVWLSIMGTRSVSNMGTHMCI